MASFAVRPLSTVKIREKASIVRNVFDYDVKYFPIVEFLENIMPKIFKDFYIEVNPIEEMGNCHGLACPTENCIKIREDVYERAIKGYGRDRFTLAHELGHFLMHQPENISFARTGIDNKIEAYRDPEWQANTFAAELLMPYELINTTNPNEIVEEFGVTYQAASIRVKKIYKH